MAATLQFDSEYLAQKEKKMVATGNKKRNKHHKKQNKKTGKKCRLRKGKFIAFTGLSVAEADSVTGVKCHFCGRTEDDESIVITEKGLMSANLEMKKLRFPLPSGVIGHGIICDECLRILGALTITPEEVEIADYE